MPEENPPSGSGAPAPEKSEIERLRDEFTEQFSAMKTSFQGQVDELSAQNEALKKHNQELERALLRSAVSPEPAPPSPEKTEEEKYKEEVELRSKRTLELMQQRYEI